MPFWIPDNWKGELLEKGIIESTPHIKEEEKITIESLNLSIILVMLHSRGYYWTIDELLVRYDEFARKYKAWKEVSNGRDFNVFGALYKLEELTLNIKHSPVINERLNEIQDEYRKLNPVFKVIEEYSNVITNSLNLSAMSALPINYSQNEDVLVSKLSDTTQKNVILRISSAKLDIAPIGYTLLQTVKMAESQEANHYRNKLDEWTKVLRNDDVNKYQSVYDDIKRSRKELSFSKSISRTGEWCTCIGVGTTCLTPILPAIGAIGIAVTILGGVCLAGDKALNFHNRWAMFGKK